MSLTSERLTPTQIGERAPACPDCKEPLVAREPYRRFPENDTYQECINGHVWRLVDSKEPFTAFNWPRIWRALGEMGYGEYSVNDPELRAEWDRFAVFLKAAAEKDAGQ